VKNLQKESWLPKAQLPTGWLDDLVEFFRSGTNKK
jgi:hypothetical protein